MVYFLLVMNFLKNLLILSIYFSVIDIENFIIAGLAEGAVSHPVDIIENQICYAKIRINFLDSLLRHDVR